MQLKRNSHSVASRESHAATTFLSVALFLVACAPSHRDFHHELHAFGTVVSLSFYDITSATNDNALHELEALYEVLGTDWYPWWNGELQRVNKAIAAGESIDVSDRLARLIRAAALFEQASGGRFNAGLAHLSEIWGMQPLQAEPRKLPDAETLASLVANRPSLLDIQWSGSTLSSANNSVMLDLGGIAKGAILAASAKILRRHNVDNSVVNIGGDLLVAGTANGEDAYIGIRSPFRDAPLAGLRVRDGECVVTSGNYERYVEVEGKRYTHVFDPMTGYPVEHTASVTVVDRDPVRADAAATALLVGGAAHFDDLVASLDLTYALLIDASGDTRLTPEMAQRVHWLDRNRTQ